MFDWEQVCTMINSEERAIIGTNVWPYRETGQEMYEYSVDIFSPEVRYPDHRRTGRRTLYWLIRNQTLKQAACVSN